MRQRRRSRRRGLLEGGIGPDGLGKVTDPALRTDSGEQGCACRLRGMQVSAGQRNRLAQLGFTREIGLAHRHLMLAGPQPGPARRPFDHGPGICG